MKRFSTNQELRITDVIFEAILTNNPWIDDDVELSNKWFDLVQNEVSEMCHNLFENN